MKTLVMTAVAALTMATFAETTDVYDFKMSAKVPYLANGVRTYQSQKMSGYLYITSDEDGNVTSATGIVQNAKTKITHTLVFKDSFYNLMGKTSKKFLRPTPTVLIEAEELDDEVSENSHEFIKAVALAGTGSLKLIKGTGCTACGEGTPDCSKLYKVSGNFVGVMDCLCPEEEDWSHTLEAAMCGLKYVADDYVRTHDASFWGTWSATWNKKLSK